jgi:hypothetical protein
MAKAGIVGYQVDHRCIVCMRIKYTRGDHEIRPEWSAIYIILVGGKVLRFAVCGLRFAVASCGCGRNLRQWSQIAKREQKERCEEWMCFIVPCSLLF